jgi:hypothetical protein
LTTSIQSCFESIACGNKPVLLFRKDKMYDIDFITNLNIPTINYNENLDKIVYEFEEIISSYPKLNNIIDFDFSPMINEIGKKIDAYNKLLGVDS